MHHGSEQREKQTKELFQRLHCLWIETMGCRNLTGRARSFQRLHILGLLLEKIFKANWTLRRHAYKESCLPCVKKLNGP